MPLFNDSTCPEIQGDGTINAAASLRQQANPLMGPGQGKELTTLQKESKHLLPLPCRVKGVII